MSEVRFGRNDLAALLLEYLEPLLGHYSPEGALLNIGSASAQYEDEVIPMEAWARPLWGLVPFWAGGGRHERFELVYQRGIETGTNPGSGEYWGTCRDHDQRFIEMGAIAYALILAPHVVWEPLSPMARGRLVSWLWQINEREVPDSNWRFFRVLVNLGLKCVGARCCQNALTEDVERLCSFYLGGGWYTDGPSETAVADHYNAFATHFFGLLYARLEERDDPAHAALFRRHARAFAHDYVRLFSARGEGVPYGRSMTYRFAQAGFWSMAAAVGADLGKPFSPAVLKGLVVRNVLAWDRRRICDNGGVLTIGYHYPNLHMAESYNAAGSSMWCLMAFACLALPADDPFWSVGPAPLPELPALAPALGGTALVARDAAGEVTLYPSGRAPGHPFAQSDAKYSKFAYSSRFAFSVARSARTLDEAAPDSMLAFVIAGRVFVRDGVKDSWLDGNAVVSRWSPWPGIEVETRVESVAGGHVRRHRVASAVSCEAYDCGFAVPGDYHEMGLEDVERVCRVRAVGEAPGEPMLVRPEANTNLACGKTLIPAVHYRLLPGETSLATEVLLADS